MDYVVNARLSNSGCTALLTVAGIGSTCATHLPLGALDQVISALTKLRAMIPVETHLARHADLSAAALNSGGV